MQLQPYLFFDGRCEEALQFYKDAAGAELQTLLRHKDNPEPSNCVPAGSEDKVMHAAFRIGQTVVMASDGRCAGRPAFQGFSLSLTLPSTADAEAVFARLAEGGSVQMPITQTFWSPCFGMLVDRFGLSWMLTVAG
jgi:PhnB protein